MNDLISRQAVIDYIREFVNHEFATDEERILVRDICVGIKHFPTIAAEPINLNFQPEVFESFVKFHNKLHGKPTEPKTAEWIPVTERLPEDWERVMVTATYISLSGEKRYGLYPEARYSKEDGWEWAYESGADYWVTLRGVIAWQPLPKPYEPRKENE